MPPVAEKLTSIRFPCVAVTVGEEVIASLADACTDIVNDFDAACGVGWSESVTLTVKLEPSWDGTPVIWPLEESERPLGNVPDASDQEVAPTAPEDCRVVLYATPCCPSGRPVVATCSDVAVAPGAASAGCASMPPNTAACAEMIARMQSASRHRVFNPADNVPLPWVLRSCVPDSMEGRTRR